MRLTRRKMIQIAAASAAAMQFTTLSLSQDPVEGEAKEIPTPGPRIARFEKMAYGMFIHWGLFSHLGKCIWACHPKRVPLDEYKLLPRKFTAAEFDGRAIAATARRAGMKYATLTSRQHDGFSLYDTRGLSDYDALHSAAGRDLIADFVEGCRAEGIAPFLYHTTYDWYQPSFNEDFDAYLDYLHSSIELLCTHYGELGGFWFDGNWSKRDADWKLDRLYGTIRRLQPQAVIINNTGVDMPGVVEHPEVDAVTFEVHIPQPMDRTGMEKYVTSEMCTRFNTWWGVVPKDFNYISPKGIIEELAVCRKAGANYLLNVGPTPGGRIPDYETAALARAGEWVERHAEPVYAGRPCGVHGPGYDFGLEADGKLYLFAYDLSPRPGLDVTRPVSGPGPRTFSGVKREVRKVRWLDTGEIAPARRAENGDLVVDVARYPHGVNSVVRVGEAM